MNDLVARAQTGDRAALNSLLRQLMPDIRRRVHRYIRPPESDDVVQTVLIEVAKSLRNFRGEANIKTWATRIAVRVSFRHIKQRKQVLPFKPNQEPHDGHMHARAVEARDSLRSLQRCLDQLSPERKMVFILQDVEGYTAPEVAQMLDIPLGTVYGRLRDARRIVKDAFEREQGRPMSRSISQGGTR